MQSKKFCFNKTIFWKNIIRFSPLWIVYLLALIIENPVALLNSILWITEKNGYTLQEMGTSKIENLTYTLSTCMNPNIVFVAAAAIALFVFSYLHITRSSNMMHALPVTRMELFVSNYLSGLVMLMVPVLITVVPMYIICVSAGYTYMNILGMWLLLQVGAGFLFYSMAVLTCMVTGVVFAVPFYYAILNFLVVGCRYILASLVMCICYGMSGSMEKYDRNSIFSPLPYLQTHVMVDWTYSKNAIDNVTVSGYGIIGIYCVAAAVFVILSAVVYKHRKLENVGKLITVKWITPVFRWGVAICVSFLSCMFISNRIYANVTAREQFLICAITLLLVGIIVFLLIEMCLEKKLRIFTKKKVLELVCYLTVVLGAASLLELDAFGLEKKVPDISEVAYATIYPSYEIVASDEDEIDQIMKIHRELINDKKENEAYYAKDGAQTYNVTITYKLKDSSTVTRNYEVPSSEEYMADKDSVANKVLGMSKENGYFMRYNFCMNYKNMQYTGGSIDLYNDYLESQDAVFTGEEISMIMDAYLRDLKEGNLDDAMWTNYGADYEEISYYNNIYVNFTVQGGIKDIYSYESQFEKGSDKDNFYYTNNGNASLTITSECANTLAVLDKLGCYSGGYRLMTNKEYSDISSKIYDDGDASYTTEATRVY